MAILSDPQVSCQSTWKSMGTKQKIKNLITGLPLLPSREVPVFLAIKR